MNAWRKFGAFVFLAIVLSTMAIPEVCADELLFAGELNHLVSAASPEEPAPDCPSEEDCLCCAHVAPTQEYTFIADPQSMPFERQAEPSTPLTSASTLYHPPRG